MAFLTFVPSGTSASGKTKVWEVRNGCLPLGEVAWYAHWRRYIFYTNNGIVFDSTCLEELAEFLKKETADHKAGVGRDGRIG